MLLRLGARTVFHRTPFRTQTFMAPKRKAATDSPPPAVSGPAVPSDGVTESKPAATPKAKRAAKPPPPPPGPVYDPATMRRATPAGVTTFNVLSWNVAGLRALMKKDPGALEALVSAESADVLCLQEHKLQDGKHCDEAAEALESHFPGWKVHWNCSTARKGYSGTAFICKEPPLSVECGIGHVDHDAEGRVLTAEFPTCFLVNVYVPNSGAELKRLDYRIKEWDVAFSEYLKGLEARGKPVVVTGDLNCAAEPIDIHDPKHNLKSAGFTPEERESFAERFLGKGLVDAFRRLHPGVVGYTYWGYRFNLRAKNKGWRLDYFLVSESLWDKILDCYHLPHVMGSDHCPLGLKLIV